MSKFLKNYSSTLILIGSIIVGGILGIVLKEKAVVLQPFGDLFLNLLFMIIVPLVFFSIASAIGSMNEAKRLGKIMSSIVVVFIATSLVASCLGLVGTLVAKPFENADVESIQKVMEGGAEEVNKEDEPSAMSQIVNTFTVSDFPLLLSKKNLLALIVFSVFFGLGTSFSKDAGKPVLDFLKSGSAVMTKMISLIMYYAPFGIACYFASMVGQLGAQILEGYAKSFVLYLVLTIIYYFGFYSLYAFISAGKTGVKQFWKNVVAPSSTALATCSSAASMPTNLAAVKKIGVPDDIAETAVPLGAAIHKDGSVIGGVFKIMFLFTLFGHSLSGPVDVLLVIGISFLVGAVMVAIPGMSMVAEMLIVTIFGFPIEATLVIAVISAIIDAPATLLNVTGNTASSMLIARMVEGKNWLKAKV